jgi:hypothetical protein
VYILLLAGIVLMSGKLVAKTDPSTNEWVYTGMSDASGAVPIGTNWLAVADDETNPIRIYRRDKGGPPVQIIDLEPVLRIGKEKPELDLEAGTLMGDRAFWIGSHGRNREGKNRPARQYFFATDIRIKQGRVELQLAGKPYHQLLSDLLTAPTLRRFKLSSHALQAPKSKNALNIEGLCAFAGNQLLIGFRNPIPQHQALLVPMKNPDEVIQGKPAQLGEPILLDLGGLGVRDMTCVDDKIYIVAGPYHEGGPFRLYQWDGGSAEPRLLPQVNFKGFHPEVIVAYPDKDAHEFQILNDDGTRRIGSAINKELPIERRQFRSLWIKL